MLDLKTRVRFVDHTSRENIVARCDRRKRDRTVIDLLAGRSNLHPCFRIRGELFFFLLHSRASDQALSVIEV